VGSVAGHRKYGRWVEHHLRLLAAPLGLWQTRGGDAVLAPGCRSSDPDEEASSAIGLGRRGSAAEARCAFGRRTVMSTESLASYRRSVDRILVNWLRFQLKRQERLRQQERLGRAAEKAGGRPPLREGPGLVPDHCCTRRASSTAGAASRGFCAVGWELDRVRRRLAARACS
jgi:hypothetical protein